MLHPNQFQVNEAWIAFKLNDVPVQTLHDGDFNFLVLMDAASCFLLSTVTLAAKQGEPTVLESLRLLEEGQSHKHAWPITLFVPNELSAPTLIAEAERLGIEVVRVEQSHLLPIIGEAKEDFKLHFGIQSLQ